jgi:hypothetical protein
MPVELKTTLLSEDVVLELTGYLDESVKFPNVSLRLSQRMIFECDGLVHVSSAAAQDWAKWIRHFSVDQQYVFRKVRPRVMHLFNVFTGFLPKHTVMESFYMPYECEKCGHEETWLAERGRDYLEAVGETPARVRFSKEINCSKCRGRMTLGFWEKIYLQFLNLPPDKPKPV